MPQARVRPRHRPMPPPHGGPIIDPPLFGRRFVWEDRTRGYPEGWEFKSPRDSRSPLVRAGAVVVALCSLGALAFAIISQILHLAQVR